jgi:hypothetical protein
MSFIRLKPTINIPHRNISTYAIHTYSDGHHMTRLLASRKVTKAPSPELPPAIGFAALCSLSTLIFEELHVLPTQKAVVVQWSAHPTWYPKPLFALPKFLISLSRVGRSLVRIQPTVLSFFVLVMSWFALYILLVLLVLWLVCNCSCSAFFLSHPDTTIHQKKSLR